MTVARGPGWELRGWRPVPGMEWLEASPSGQIRTWRNRFGHALAAPRSPFVDRSGSRPRVYANGRRHTISRLVCAAFHGPAADGEVCRHLNGDECDNRPENLAWGSYADNEADKMRHGRVVRGEAHHQAKLTDECVRSIRAWRGTVSACAREFGVSRRLVRLILDRKVWRHV